MRNRAKSATQRLRRAKSGLPAKKRAREHFVRIKSRTFRGIAQILDIGNTLGTHPTFATPDEADAYALRSDWAAVGQDIRHAIKHFEAKDSTTLGRRKN